MLFPTAISRNLTCARMLNDKTVNPLTSSVVLDGYNAFFTESRSGLEEMCVDEDYHHCFFKISVRYFFLMFVSL